MTMQTSGPISIGQARNECGQGNPINAGNFYLSRLAGVSQGQHYAWHYWYGKSNVTPITNQYISGVAVNADRYVYCYFDLLNWRFQWGQNSSDNSSGVMWIYPQGGSQQNLNQSAGGITTSLSAIQSSPIPGGPWVAMSGTPIANITAYHNFNATVAFQAGNTRTVVQVSQQPSAANGYTIGVMWNDDVFGGAAGSQYGISLSASA